MTVIIGIDPGSRCTGYGVIRLQGNRHEYIESGYLDLTSYPTVTLRLRHIFLGLQKIMGVHQPQEAAIEQIFMYENANSALKLGQARGAAMVALSVPVSEYTARQVKKSVVGHGAATKEQVQYMVQKLLNLSRKLQPDAADALAVALCHAQARGINRLLANFEGRSK